MVDRTYLRSAGKHSERKHHRTLWLTKPDVEPLSNSGMYAKNYLLDPKEKNLGVKEKLSLRKFGAKSSLPDRSFFRKRAQHPIARSDLDTFLLPCASTVFLHYIMTCFSCAAMVFRYSKRARTFFTKYVPSRSFWGHVTWNSAVPDPNVWCCTLLFLCTLDPNQNWLYSAPDVWSTPPRVQKNKSMQRLIAYCTKCSPCAGPRNRPKSGWCGPAEATYKLFSRQWREKKVTSGSFSLSCGLSWHNATIFLIKLSSWRIYLFVRRPVTSFLVSF